MQNQDILSHCDYTVLKALTTIDDVVKLCETAINFKTASVCIPPSFVQRVSDLYGDTINICTVIGFPLGYSTTEVKIFESLDAIKNGASEIDMVINLGFVKESRFDLVEEEIRTIKEAIEDVVLKVIIETCYLEDDEILKLTRIIESSGAEFIKTSTGFGPKGATFEGIKLMKSQIKDKLKMKAAGGIRSKEDMEAFLQLGVDRLGVSSIDSIIEREE